MLKRACCDISKGKEVRPQKSFAEKERNSWVDKDNESKYKGCEGLAKRN